MVKRNKLKSESYRTILVKIATYSYLPKTRFPALSSAMGTRGALWDHSAPAIFITGHFIIVRWPPPRTPPRENGKSRDILLCREFSLEGDNLCSDFFIPCLILSLKIWLRLVAADRLRCRSIVWQGVAIRRLLRACARSYCFTSASLILRRDSGAMAYARVAGGPTTIWHCWWLVAVKRGYSIWL